MATCGAWDTTDVDRHGSPQSPACTHPEPNASLKPTDADIRAVQHAWAQAGLDLTAWLHHLCENSESRVTCMDGIFGTHKGRRRAPDLAAPAWSRPFCG